MREIKDERQIEQWAAAIGARECFDTPNLRFQLFRYEKKEVISSPDAPLDKLLFLLEGTVQIYGIRDDGSMSPVNSITRPALLGEVEFSGASSIRLFAEASTKVTCLALPFSRYRSSLDKDVRFLHTLLASVTRKLDLFSSMDALTSTLEERLLLYMRTGCPGMEIDGMDATALRLHCSRRQLQRVLRRLCEENVLLKTGKGRYRLADSASH